MVEGADPNLIQSRRKAISVLFPYAVHLARRGQREMLDAFSRVSRASDSRHFMWHHIKPFTMMLFDKPNPPPLNWVLGLTSPGVILHDQPHNDSAVAWTAASPSYTDEVDRNVVGEVLRVAFTTPGLPLTRTRTEEHAVRQIRALGGTGVLGSYLLLLLSRGGYIGYPDEDFAEMQISIREDFSGIGMSRYREDLIKCLDRALEDLWGWTAESYGELKRLLLEVDDAAEKILTRTPPWLIHSSLDLINPADTYRITLDVRVRPASPVPVTSHLRSPPLLPATENFIRTFAAIVIVVFLYPSFSLSSVPHSTFPNGYRTG